jgi:hypothetical protein
LRLGPPAPSGRWRGNVSRPHRAKAGLPGRRPRGRFEPETGTGGLKPYLHVRRDLWAKVTRAVFFDLVDLGEEREVAEQAMFGVTSMGEFFPMAPAEQVREFA